MADTIVHVQSDKLSRIQAPVSDAARQHAAEAVRQSAQAVQQGSHAASETVRPARDVATETAQRSGQAGAEAVQRAGNAASEMMFRGTEVFADSQRQFVQNASKQLEEMSRKVAQGATEGLRAFMTLPNAANDGLQDLSQSMAELVEGVMRANLRATEELLQLANPSAFVELQQRFMREYLDVMMQGAMTLVSATRRTADETLRPLEQQIEQRRQVNQSRRHQYASYGRNWVMAS
jgi:hypothetical protein